MNRTVEASIWFLTEFPKLAQKLNEELNAVVTTDGQSEEFTLGNLVDATVAGLRKVANHLESQVAEFEDVRMTDIEPVLKKLVEATERLNVERVDGANRNELYE